MPAAFLMVGAAHKNGPSAGGSTKAVLGAMPGAARHDSLNVKFGDCSPAIQW
jgi:hypothetical protein